MNNNSHHGDHPAIEQLRKEIECVGERPGPTGRFPRGQITPQDEGELRLAVAHADGVVIIDFGKPVSWLGFAPHEARQFADLVLKHASECEGANGG